MASRQSESEALVRRVEKVGWEVTRNKAGYRVKSPRGLVAVVHLTYSDRNSIDMITRKLEAMGLAEAEDQMADEKATVRAGRLAKASAANFSSSDTQDTEELAAAAALARASGPYLTPERVGVVWFAQEHPKPWMRWVLMTPEIARYLMDNHNGDNRPLREGRVEHYKSIILRDEWHLTHQGMAMDSRAVVQDGQHRLAAIARAGEVAPGIELPVPFYVGMDPKNFLAIDEGLNRSPQDLFAKGGESYGTTISSAIRLIIGFDSQSPRRMVRERQTNETLVNFFGTDPDELRHAARFGTLNYKKAYMNAGPLAAARYVLRRANGTDNRYVEAFFTGLISGTKAGTRTILDEVDPRRVARQFFENARLNHRTVRPIEAMSIVVLAWNNVCEGKTPRFVRFTDDSPIPRIVVAKDDGTPQALVNCPKALEGEFSDD